MMMIIMNDDDDDDDAAAATGVAAAAADDDDDNDDPWKVYIFTVEIQLEYNHLWYRGITWVPWCLESQAQMFVQQHVQTSNEKNKAPHYLPFEKGSTSDG